MKLILPILIILGLSTFLTTPKAYAEANIANQNSWSPAASPNGINEKLQKINQAIHDNQKAIVKADLEEAAAVSEVQKLEKDISLLKNSMEKRNNVLKERALSYQQSNRHLSYLDVLLGSTSLSDFIDRVGAVASIVEADRTLLEQQESEKNEYDSKKAALDKKLTGLLSTKTDLEGMRSMLSEQKGQYEGLKKQIETVKVTEYIEPPVLEGGNVKKIISAGYKYIGNSVYVFGGGRNEYDVANGRFDCSGFVHWAFSQAGIELGWSTDSIKNSGAQVSLSKMRPGDLVFFDTYKKDGHVGIYLGNGKFIGSQSSTGVAIADMSTGYWKEKFNGRVVRI
ncbi:NlpC/P60 family protein [Paenibacillus sp. BSR1-1]|uniref:C40 family peptidase n=1 Tax=Paenibacillus sp. BSR1-1 TaxID=3020845 RepID=UPI0025B01669|nr:C40 family peptidase [Paenibacillus sp. BSR1-1]MDN3015404.1 NlpC/P60 family protein [Paenibacillus sp. BSR1-1]